MAIVDLNESGLGLVRTAGDITPAWVEGILRRGGHLEDGVSVSGVDLERIGEGVGILSIIQKIIPTYSGPTAAPKSLVVKYPTDDPGQRFTADALTFYVREIVFYRDIAPGAPFRTARCYAQAIATENTDFTIVMEDISGLTQLNQLAGITLEQAGVLVDQLADFHAMWWDSPKLDEMIGWFPPLSNPVYHMVLPSLWDAGWPAMLERAPEIVPAEIADIGGLWSGKVQWMLDSLMSPATLCHGDYRADNLMFDGDKPVVLDFQIVGKGSGIYDLGYFISQSLSRDVRRGHDRELFDRYCDRLAGHGISVDRDEMWRQYLITVFFCAIYSVTNWPQYDNMNDRGQSLLRDMLERSLGAIVDVGAMSAIE